MIHLDQTNQKQRRKRIHMGIATSSPGDLVTVSPAPWDDFVARGSVERVFPLLRANELVMTTSAGVEHHHVQEYDDWDLSTSEPKSAQHLLGSLPNSEPGRGGRIGCLSPDQTRIYLADSGAIVCFSLPLGKIIYTCAAKTDSRISCMAINKSGTKLACGYACGNLRVYSTAPASSSTLGPLSENSSTESLSMQQVIFRDLEFAGNDFLVGAASDGTFRLMNEQLAEVWNVHVGPAARGVVSMSPDSQFVCAASMHQMKVLRVSDGALVGSVKLKPTDKFAPIVFVCFVWSEHSRFLILTSHYCGELCFWDVLGGKHQEITCWPYNSGGGLSPNGPHAFLAPDQKFIASCCPPHNKKVRIFNFKVV